MPSSCSRPPAGSRGVLAREDLEQLLLRAVARLARLLRRVGAVRTHLPGLDVVREVRLEPLADDARLELLVEDREAELDAPEEVAIHPVGARQVDVLLAVGAEVE